MKTTTRPATATGRANTARKSASWRRLIPYALGAAVLFILVNALRPKPIAVETGVVTRGPLTVTVLEEGKTRIRHRYIISPPVAGYLNRVPLRAGDRIEAGNTVLATIQPQPAGFLDPRARAEAEARVNAAEASKMLRETQIERANAALDLAQRELARAKELKKSGAIASSEWDAAENLANVLGREVRTAEFALQVAKFELTQAQAALTQVQTPDTEGVSPLEIRAPVSGFVLSVFEENARVLAAGTQIMEVGDPTDLEAEIEMLSSDAVAVQPGAKVSIEQWGGENPLPGKVTMVERGAYTKVSALGVEEQRVKVRVEFAEPLPPGVVFGDRFRVEARIITWHGEDVLQVPTGALFRRGGEWMTFLLKGGRARPQQVKIGHNNGMAAEVRSELSEGQTVILHPPDAVTEGCAVRMR